MKPFRERILLDLAACSLLVAIILLIWMLISIVILGIVETWAVIHGAR